MIKQMQIAASLKVFNPQEKEVIRMKRSLLILMMVLPLIAFFVSANQIYAAEEEEIDWVPMLIETATTPEDHIKIAEFYEMQAAKMEEKAAKHSAMATAYKTRSKPWLSMVRHCESLVTESKVQADEYSKMAAEHRKMAEESQAQ